MFWKIKQWCLSRKIFVKDIAQKTDAYQLSKALILDEQAEFNAKPELEIYADDVKCSHGSTSGSIDEDSVHYLMTEELNCQWQAKKLLINGFLNEILENVPESKLKTFLEKCINEQVNGIDNIKSKFPIFKQKIKGKPLIYLDSANSSQKPKTVIDEISRFYETEFSNVGRSVHI